MFTSLLVANRGEIACRVFASARRLGIRTIAVYSDVDAGALHVAVADEAVCIGAAPAQESYLDITKIIAAAQSTGAEAIHPGYGFLSENAEFARACEVAGITFVGPSASAIATMGSKTESKRLMEAAGVPVLPGYHGDNQAPDFLASRALEVGFPLLIKASAGGGGKGMRIVASEDEFADQLAAAKRESLAAFGDDKVLLERYLTSPKHIEVQVMADAHGNVLHLFERDCSVQRRHQKVIEEAPGPTVDAALRQRLGSTAVMAAQKVDYQGAGTVEFIAQDGEFYFMEMNTRLQVEHPVTEAITGLDLVELQLKVAAGEKLDLRQEDLEITGHAVEVRLYAENPAKQFLPSTGTLVHFEMAEGLRVDTGVRQGDVVSMHYDPMLAKLIGIGSDRTAAVNHLVEQLRLSRVAGVAHNLGYLVALLQHPQFAAGDYTTSIAEAVHDGVVAVATEKFALLGALFALASHAATPDTTQSGGLIATAQPGFRLNLPPRVALTLRQGKREFEIQISGRTAHVNDQTQFNLDAVSVSAETGELVLSMNGQSVAASVVRDGSALHVMVDGHTERFVESTDDIGRYAQQRSSKGAIVSPMPGQVLAMHAQRGQKVRRGDVLAVVEAMKMEHSISAPRAGVVRAVHCAVGDRVSEGMELVELE